MNEENSCWNISYIWDFCEVKEFLCVTLTAVNSFSQKTFVSVLDFKTLCCAKLLLSISLALLLLSHIQYFSTFLPTLTLADSMLLGSGLCGWAMEGDRCRERRDWSLQLEGDLDQMVASLLQMHFTLPYLLLAHCRTVTDRVLSQQLWVWRWVAGVGGQWDLQWALIQPGR